MTNETNGDSGNDLTLHWRDANVDVHKVVVGPFDNNVFVVRCRRSGDAVLIDAANEHEQLLQLCRRLGTALSDRQLQLVRSGNPRIVLALDADAAGSAATRISSFKRASLRTSPRGSNAGVSSRSPMRSRLSIL